MKRQLNLLKDIGFSLLGCLVLVLFAFLGTAHCQLPLSPSPMPRLQFFDKNGKPLAGGKIFTYAAGTTTLLNTFTDSSGLFFNTDPIILDAGGFGSIWLGNSAYKFVVQDRLGQPQWTADNFSGVAGLTNLANTWGFAQVFSQPITITSVNNQIVTGAVGNQTTLDFPPPVGIQALHFPSTTDTVVGRATTDTLTNKTLTSAILNTPTLNTPTLNVATLGGGTTINGTYSVCAPSGATPCKFINVDTGGTLRFLSNNQGNVLFELGENSTATVHAHIQQAVTGTIGGHCTMAAATSCTFSLPSGPFNTTPICIASVQSTTVIAGSCAISSTTVTITAASSNSSTWGAVLFGDPN